jgi:hypothetical protein
MDQPAAVLPLQAPKDVSLEEIEQELNKSGPPRKRALPPGLPPLPWWCMSR